MDCRPWACVVLVMLISEPCQVYASPQEQTQAEGEAIIKRAKERSDIRCEGCPPFRLRADLRAFQEHDWHVLQGTFEEHWQSAGQWRSTFQFPGFSQLRIASQNRVWSPQDSLYPPYVIFVMSKMLTLPMEFNRRGSQKIENVSDVTVDGNHRWIVRGSAGNNLRSFDNNSGLLVSEDTELNGFGERIEYSLPEPFGDKLVPRAMQYLRDGKLLFEVHVSEIAAEPAVDESLFNPAAGGESWPLCQDVKTPTPIEKPEPEYTEAARRNKVEGNVVLYMVIGLDGRPHATAVVSAIDAGLASQSKETITRRWNFRPANCAGEPVPVSVFAQVSFRLRFYK